MNTEERSYLRVQVAGLKVFFNCIEQGENNSLYVNFAERPSPFASDSLEERNPFQDFVAARLQRIETKLDFLIRQLQKQSYGKPYDFEATVRDISGGGFSMSTSVTCGIGTLLDLCLFPEHGNLPSFYALGKAQWIDKQEDQLLVGVEFVAISEEDREMLLRTIFQLDRRQKRGYS